MSKGLLHEFTKGLWKEIPPFRFVLGLCATLAVTNTIENGLGMGIALTFVLTLSNAIISLMRKVIPNEVRVASYIVIIAAFVVLVEMTMKAYFYSLSESLGIFIPLIVVNCIILGRAEAFAKKNPVLPSILDGLGMGVGFTISLVLVAFFRELFGSGTLLGTPVWSKLGVAFEPMNFLQQAPGAFVTLGLLLGVMNVIGAIIDRRAAGRTA